MPVYSNPCEIAGKPLPEAVAAARDDRYILNLDV
jgi:hypothetical protein